MTQRDRVDEERWQEQRGSFGATAADYDAHRPEWPQEAARWLTGTEADGPEPGARRTVLDVGAGTGKLTRTLAGLGHGVTALDPSEGMLAALASAVPGVPVLVGSAEAIPLPDRSVDVVTAAQAWHWFDTAAAGAECARVLRPGGLLGVAWHVKDTAEPWVAELGRIVGLPMDSDDSEWGEGLAAGGWFHPVEERLLRYDQPLTPEALVALAGTWSYVATRADRDDVLAQVADLGRRTAGPDGTLLLPHRTRLFRLRRR